MKSILMVNRSLLAIFLVTRIASTETFSQPRLKKDEAITAQRQAARQMWELAIAAKGGRMRLHTVRNFVTLRQFVMTSTGKEFDVSEEQFYVFPDRMYERKHVHDRRGPHSQLTVNVCDLRVPVCWHQSNLRAPYSRPDVLKKYPTRSFSSWFYLMETKWEQPEPIKTKTERVGFSKYDLVQTVVGGMRVDYYLDRKTHLPARLITYSALSGDERIAKGFYRLEEYVGVNGVMMPQKVTAGNLEPEQRSYQIDVEYDERIFERPPMVDLGPGAWRPRK